jgi:hypothetical protein
MTTPQTQKSTLLQDLQDCEEDDLEKEREFAAGATAATAVSSTAPAVPVAQV